MKTPRLLLLPLLLFATALVAAKDEQGFVSLFDGQTLEGWHKVGGTGEYRVEDGCIVGYGENIKGNTFLRTDKTYADFEFRFSFKLTHGNSGMMFRARQRPGDNGRVYGYQCEHDNRPQRAWSAGLYDEARRGWLQPHDTDPRGQQAFTEQGQALIAWEGWNDVRIRCEDRDLKIWLNGELRVHFVDTSDEHFTPDGFFGLQVHSGERSLVHWKNLRVKELD